MKPNPLHERHAEKTRHADVNKTLAGMSEDEALDWAAANEVEFDVAEQPTDHEHMVGCVLSAARNDDEDDRVTIVVGIAPAAPGHELHDVAELVPVGAPLVDLDQAESDDLDDYFRNIEDENEQLAEEPDVAYVDDEDDAGDPLDDLADEVTQVQPIAVVDEEAPRQERRVSKKAIAVAALVLLALVSVISSLPSQKSPKVTPPASAAAASPVMPAKQTTPRRASSARPRSHKTAKRRVHHKKRRRASARQSTPQAAPRPVVPVTQPATSGASPSGSCGSRSSEFSFEC